MPQKGYVRLQVFDMLGREVAALVDQELVAGDYKIRFEAGTLTSGMYIARLITNGISRNKKMMLIK